MGSRFELSVAGDVARLQMVWPEGRNAVDPLWVTELVAALDALEAEPAVRALLISGDGPAFSVGGDMRHFSARADRIPAELDEMIGGYHPALERLAGLPYPVVCAVNGGAGGGALGLVWCADVAIAAEDARFATGFTALGLSGDGGSTWFLPRLVGLRRARELMLHNRVLSATEALAWGLIDRVVPAAELAGVAEETVAQLAAGPTIAYGEMRRLQWRSFSVDLGQGLQSELEAIVRCGATDDAREGVTAFNERRPPKFSGR